MKIIVFSADTVCDGKFYRAGEVASVDDTWRTNIRRVIADSSEIKRRTADEIGKVQPPKPIAAPIEEPKETPKDAPTK